MGNFYGRSSQGDGGTQYVNDRGGTVLRAVEDIAKLSYNDMEREFDHICKSSNTMLRTFTEDPCQRLSSRIISCLNENAMQMSKCFNVMDQYQACVSARISDKMVEVLDELERPPPEETPSDAAPPDTESPDTTPPPVLIPTPTPKPMQAAAH